MKAAGLIWILILTRPLMVWGGGAVLSSLGSSNLNWAFEENKGQIRGEDASSVRYCYRHGSSSAFLLRTGIAYQFERRHSSPASHSEQPIPAPHRRIHPQDSTPPDMVETYRMDLELMGANPHALVSTEGRSADYIQYYNHNALDVHAYQKIIYHDIYPHIDWVISTQSDAKGGASMGFKYDFVVRPGGRPEDIRIRIRWAESLYLDEEGGLVLTNRLGTVRESPPISFQGGQGIETAFILEDSLLRFRIGNYDLSQSLTIDPLSRIWGTYYGGGGIEYGWSTIVDKEGNSYLAGQTSSFSAIAAGGFKVGLSGLSDAFLVKFSPNGTRLWATYYGGVEDDRGNGCAVDIRGNVYLCGSTNSPNLIASGGFQNSLAGNNDVFLVKFNSNGSRLWATYYGGSNREYAGSCASDSEGNVYLVGETNSINQIAYQGHQNSYGGGTSYGGDVFLVKFDSMGARLWATYYGGADDEVLSLSPNNISIDLSNQVYLSGRTRSSNGIAYLGHRTSFASGGYSHQDFLVKFRPNGQRIWATYYGGLSVGIYLEGGCAADSKGNVYLSGSTESPTGIFYQGHQSSFGGGSSNETDAYLVKFDSMGTRLWGTYYGGSGYDFGSGCTVDEEDNAVLVGRTSSVNAISFNGFQNTCSGITDAFLAKFNPQGVRIWGTYYGGGSGEDGNKVASDHEGHIYLVGYTQSSGSGIASGGHQNTFGGGSYDAFLVKFFDSLPPSIRILDPGSMIRCQGDTVVLTTSIKHGGQNPRYRWYRNGTLVDTNASYTTDSLRDGDSIQCQLLSSHPKAQPTTAWSQVLKWTIYPRKSSNHFDTTCSNQPYIWEGIPRTQTGIYQARYQTVHGCDSTLQLALLVKPVRMTSDTQHLCEGYSYTFGGKSLTLSGDYSDTLSSIEGCDSIARLHLVVEPSKQIHQRYDTICDRDSIYFDQRYIRTSGVYLDTLVSLRGCDSIVEMHLRVVSFFQTSLQKQLCHGDSFYFNQRYERSSGVYTARLTSLAGCDSVVTLTLDILPSVYPDTQTLIVCSPYRLGGTLLRRDSSYRIAIANRLGCDSIDRLILIRVEPEAETLAEQTMYFCDSMMYRGVQRRQSFTAVDTLRKTILPYCDSIYRPMRYEWTTTPAIRIESYPSQSAYFSGDQIELEASPAAHYLWSLGDTSRQILHSVEHDIQIYVIGWDSPLCPDTAYIQIAVEMRAMVDFPLAFSPRSLLEENRVFRPNYRGEISLIRFEVFNRWGEKVFSTNRLNEGWDGSYQGVAQDPGSYSYICEYIGNRLQKRKTGSVLLIR